MTVQEFLQPQHRDARLQEIIKLAIYAVGGQGGGVLIGWIEDLARSQGYAAQATSVAGVSQRTGATIYYIEMAPLSGLSPVFSLMPASGDLDVMIAAEWMEAGRAILRGFVTPDRTTLIASTHRNLAVSEKIVPGDGLADAEAVREAALQAARKLISADFEAIAVDAGSVISASLFGALAASKALPFPRESYEAAIRAGGKGVEQSLRAFAAGYSAAEVGTASAPKPAKAPADPKVSGPAKLMGEWQNLAMRAANLPGDAPEMAMAGLRKIVDFQDITYGVAYLDRLELLAACDRAPFDLTREGAKYIANAMAYDDPIRVADLKTRAARFDRIRDEMGAGDRLMQLTEFMHPGAGEIAGMMPRSIGERISASPRWMARLDRWFNKGRRIRTDSLRGYLLLYILGGMKHRRPGSWRHAQEMAHLEQWLAAAMDQLERNYELSVEILRCRRLIKGYSDTHARGLSKYDLVMQGIALVADRPDAADWARRLREAALQDEKGLALEGALQTIRSFI